MPTPSWTPRQDRTDNKLCPKCGDDYVCLKDGEHAMWCSNCQHTWECPPLPFQPAIDYDLETARRIAEAGLEERGGE
jgi:hypothetical protein